MLRPYQEFADEYLPAVKNLCFEYTLDETDARVLATGIMKEIELIYSRFESEINAQASLYVNTRTKCLNYLQWLKSQEYADSVLKDSLQSRPGRFTWIRIKAAFLALYDRIRHHSTTELNNNDK